MNRTTRWWTRPQRIRCGVSTWQGYGNGLIMGYTCLLPMKSPCELQHGDQPVDFEFRGTLFSDKASVRQTLVCVCVHSLSMRAMFVGMYFATHICIILYILMNYPWIGYQVIHMVRWTVLMVEIYNFSGDSVSKVVLPRIDTEEQNCCFFLVFWINLNILNGFWVLFFGA